MTPITIHDSEDSVALATDDHMTTITHSNQPSYHEHFPKSPVSMSRFCSNHLQP